MEMTSKEALYSKLMKAYSNHVNRDTLITNYVNNVIKIMKEYLHIEQLEKENQSLQGLLETTKQDNVNIRLENERLKKENQNLKEDLRLTTIERTNCEDRFYKEHLKCCELEKENQDFRYIFKAIKELGELHLEKQVNGEFTYYAIVIGDFFILIEEEQYKLLKEVIKNGRDNKISD